MAKASIIKTNQYLTFKLGPEVFALDVGNAREIVEYGGITQIPGTPEWICGVLNLRGAVVPIVDLKQRFKMGRTERGADACIVVVETALGDELFVVGVLVDSVQEVFEFDEAQVEPPPNFGTRVSTEYLRGLGRRGEKLFIILDAERVFSSDELTQAQSAAASNAAAQSLAG